MVGTVGMVAGGWVGGRWSERGGVEWSGRRTMIVVVVVVAVMVESSSGRAGSACRHVG